MTDYVFGRNPVLAALTAGRRRPRRLHVLEGATGLEAVRAAAPRGLPMEPCDRRRLDALADGAAHQGVILEADPLPVSRVEDWAAAWSGEAGLVVVLDGVEDPHNFGAIVRSACACGSDAVVFGKRRAAPLSPASAKTAAGAMEYVPLVQAANITRALKLLKSRGFWVAGLEAEAPQCLWEADLTGNIALVVGGEGAGMHRLVREACDFVLRIPLTGAMTSLNASVSAGMALYECARQRAGQPGA